MPGEGEAFLVAACVLMSLLATRLPPIGDTIGGWLGLTDRDPPQS
jgi:hypothetical protein